MDSGQKIICPLCNDTVDRLLYRFHVDDERRVLEKIKADHPDWSFNDGACSRCVDYYRVAIIREQRIVPAIGPHFPVKSCDDFVILPTPLRIDAHPGFTGKGVTICFIDSGFYPHPDLVATKNRIKKIIHINGSEKQQPLMYQWHGTMTTVVCAGDGYLSKGLYRGPATDAELVLVSVQDEEGKVTSKNIALALQWVLDHHKEFSIRVINISLGGDECNAYRESTVDLLAEALIKEGVIIVSAVGNDENGQIHAPANAPNVIAVGGVDDENLLDNESIKAYHSSYGTTPDAFMKPELVAPAIWIAAPVLPETRQKKEAASLYRLMELEGAALLEQLEECMDATGLGEHVMDQKESAAIKEAIKKRIQQCKYISPDYMHVDGTSFAAPIVTAVIAQLLEVNPGLTPKMIREILFSTARRAKGIVPERQGFGIISPRRAVVKVLKHDLIVKPNQSPFINRDKNIIEFYIHNEWAEQISLSGTFNEWARDILLLEPSRNAVWKIEIPMLPGGKYAYKFLADGSHWMEDVDNPYREPDGFSGFNSLLFIDHPN